MKLEQWVRSSAALDQLQETEASLVFGEPLIHGKELAKSLAYFLPTNILFAVIHLSGKGQDTSEQEGDPEQGCLRQNSFLL